MIIQEGVPTCEAHQRAVAEPVVYMLDRYVVGGFYRVHADRGIDEPELAGRAVRAAGLRGVGSMARAGAKPGASAPNRLLRMASSGGWRCWRPATSWRPPILTPRCTPERRHRRLGVGWTGLVDMSPKWRHTP